MRYHVCQFSDKTTTLTFWAQICPKMNFGVWMSLDSESAPPRYHVSQFSVKMDNFEFFGLNLEKLSNYVRYFGWNIVEGVAESWLKAGMTFNQCRNRLFWCFTKFFFHHKWNDERLLLKKIRVIFWFDSCLTSCRTT